MLERVQSTASAPPQSPQSSDYESEMSNDNDNESESSSELSSLSTATSATLPGDVSPRPAASTTQMAQMAPIAPAGGFSELERVLLLTLPYFEGDYLPYIGEDLLKEIFQDAQKPKTPRSVGEGGRADA